MLLREHKGEIKGIRYGSREVPRADKGDEGECEIDESWEEMERRRNLQGRSYSFFPLRS